ncbi:peptidase MA family metallohydrolase [Chloroflexota bacterium]
MIKKISLSALIICLLLVVLSPGLTQASSGLAVLSSSAEVDFPTRLDFNLSVKSDVDITDIRLHYQVDRMKHAQVTSEVYIEFMPDVAVEVEWIWDMRKTGGLPPGSSVEYWWTVADAKGDKVETKSVQIQIVDNRYSWQSLMQGKVTLYWYEGDDSFTHALMMTTQQALVRLARDTGAEPEKPVEIYIYANARDLRGSMIFPQEWTGGVAFTRYGIIAIGIAPNSLGWGIRAIAHELTHLVIHQMTFNPYGDLPTWLDEGLAMYAEGKLEPLFSNLLDGAVAEGNLISVRSLASPFSAYAEESSLAYAQSYSLVKFLIDGYGQRKMFELLNIFKQGSGYDEALVEVYSFDMDGLNALWGDYIGADAVTVP